MNGSQQGGGGTGTEIRTKTFQTQGQSGIERILQSLAEERRLASRTTKRARVFKRTMDGRWERQTSGGRYDKLNATQLIKRLQAAISKQLNRGITE